MNEVVFLADKLAVQGKSITVQLDNIEKRLHYIKNDLEKFQFLKRMSDIELFAEDVGRLASFTRVLSNTCQQRYEDHTNLNIPTYVSNKMLYEAELMNHLESELECIDIDLKKFRKVLTKSNRTEKMIDEIATAVADLVPYAMRLVDVTKKKNKSLEELPSTLTDMSEHNDEMFPETVAASPQEDARVDLTYAVNKLIRIGTNAA